MEEDFFSSILLPLSHTPRVLKNTTVVFENKMGVLKIPRGGIKHTMVLMK
jgi:hypothetical protein